MMGDLSAFKTVELVEELKLREGVKRVGLDEHVGFDIEIPYQSMSDSGPATILVVTD